MRATGLTHDFRVKALALWEHSVAILGESGGGSG